MDTRSRSTRVLMFPWLAHGHISPFLQLAKSLANKNFITYICSSQVNLNSIKNNISPKYSISIKLVELHIPELPPHYHTTNGLPPHLMGPLKKAFDLARPAFSTILSTLKPDLLVYDFLQPWAPEEAASQNIPAVLFFSTGAASTSLMAHHFLRSSSEYPFLAIHFTEKEYSAFLLRSSSDDNNGGRVEECIARSCDVVLIKSFRQMEGKYIDFLSRLTRKKFVPVGPLVHQPVDEEDGKKEQVLIEWLDRKGVGTTVFASFGSEYFLSENEIGEIAQGLEMSGVNFIWVVRFPLGEERVKTFEERLPSGFVERVKGRGMVVEGWAPQRAILSHRSVGGFLSHCGWSSVMEGLYYGVPIVAMPMHLDQPLNARLVVEGGWGEEVGRVERGEVARVVRRVVVEESGEEVRLRVADMSERMRGKGEEEEEIGGVVEEMVRLCWRRERLNLESEDSMKKLDRLIIQENQC